MLAVRCFPSPGTRGICCMFWFLQTCFTHGAADASRKLSPTLQGAGLGSGEAVGGEAEYGSSELILKYITSW